MKNLKNLRYVCDMEGVSKEFDPKARALNDNLKKQVELAVQMRELEAQTPDLWRALFDAAVGEGKLPKHAAFDKTGMQVSDDNTQLFAYDAPEDGENSGIEISGFGPMDFKKIAKALAKKLKQE